MALRPVDQEEVIDLLSDYDSDEDYNLGYDASAETPQDFHSLPGTEAIDLTSIPDVDIPPDPLPVDHTHAADSNKLVPEEACLQMILDVLPGISVSYALNIIQEKTQDDTRTTAECERLITQILDDGMFPKEQDEINKRKRKSDEDEDDFSYDEGERNTPSYHKHA